MFVRFEVVASVHARGTDACAFGVVWGPELIAPFVTVVSDSRGCIGCAVFDSGIVVVSVVLGRAGRVILNVSLCLLSRKMLGVVFPRWCISLTREVCSRTIDAALLVVLVRGG